MDAKASLYAGGLRPKAAAAADLIREHGPFRFTFRLLPWLLRRRYLAFTQWLTDLPVPSAAPEGLTLSLAEPADVDALARFRRGFYSAALVEHRLREGHLCFLAREGGRLVHVRWFFTGSVFLPYLGRTLVLAPGEVYSDEAFTSPRDRGRRVHSRAGILIRLRLREMGFLRYTNLVASWNASPLRTMARLGAAPVGECRRTGFPGRRRLSYSGGVREAGEGRIAILPPETGPFERA